MANTFMLPQPSFVSGLLTTLLGMPVKTTKAAPAASQPNGAIAAGVYVTEDGGVGALCIVDLTLASFAGAALSMIPQGVALESAKRGTLDDMIAENLQEIFNVCVGFFNQGNVPHIRFSNTCLVPPALPGSIQSFASTAPSRLDLDVEIAGYGRGTMRLQTI